MGRPTGARVSGPLQPFVCGFLIELVELGYEFTTQCARLRLMAELSSWMAARGIEPAGLTAPLVSEFLESARARAPGRAWCSPMSERQLVAYLIGLGLVPRREAPVVTDPLDRLLVEFVEYLERERGQRSTRRRFTSTSGRLVCSCRGASILMVAALSVSRLAM